MMLWRIATAVRGNDPADISGAASSVHPGRWNSEGSKVVYCAPSRAMASLESMTHVPAGCFPLRRFLIAIDVPDNIWRRRKTAAAESLDPAWSSMPAGPASVDFGTSWLRAETSALFEVPSIIVHEESVVLINPAHPDADQIAARVAREFDSDILFRR